MEELVSRIFTGQLNEKPGHIRRITGGAENIVYSVNTTRGRKIIRMNRDYLSTYLKEQWAMAQARSKGVHVPQVNAIGSCDGYDYMVIGYIDGIAGNAYKGDLIPVYRQLGQIAATINSIRTTGYGHAFTPAPSPHFDFTWQHCVASDNCYIFEHDILKNLNLFTALEESVIRDMLQARKFWDFPSCLSHNDMNLANVIIHESGSLYLIDWSRASGQPAMVTDIGDAGSQIKDPAHFRAFVEGYGLSNQEFEKIRNDILCTSLAHALRAARWAAEDCPEELDKFLLRSKDLIKTAIDKTGRDHPAR